MRFVILVTFMTTTMLIADDRLATTIEISGKAEIINGVGTVPAAMFGIHNMPMTDKVMAEWGIESSRIIDQHPNGKPLKPGSPDCVPKTLPHILECFYDRYQPAHVLTNPNWKRDLENLARAYGENAKGSSRVHTVEFWNEPYLNWGVKPGVNYDGAHFDESKAVMGGPVTIKGWDKPLEFLRWTKGLKAFHAETGRPFYLAWGYMPRNAKAGDTYDFRGTPYTLREVWTAKDITQDQFYAGKQNSQFYRWMLTPFAKALKESNPDVTLVAGWGFHISQDGWKPWKSLFKPLIDENIKWIDGLNEHHYGGDSRRSIADYEVVSAYTVTTHNKWLKFYNTEAGGQLDPQRPDSVLPHSAGSKKERAVGALTYFLRDVIYALRFASDKAVWRAAHHPHHNGGDELAFKILKPLRGTLMHTDSMEYGIWTVASLQTNAMCVAIFNDNRETVGVPVRVRTPVGSRFESCTLSWIDTDGEFPTLKSRELKARGDAFEQILDVNSKSAAVLRFVLKGDSRPEPLTTTQHYSADILKRIDLSGQYTTSIDIPEDVLRDVKRVRLKCVLADYDGKGELIVNGKTQPLLFGNYIHEQEIPIEWIRAENTLQFRSTSGRQYSVNMASLVITR